MAYIERHHVISSAELIQGCKHGFSVNMVLMWSKQMKLLFPFRILKMMCIEYWTIFGSETCKFVWQIISEVKVNDEYS